MPEYSICYARRDGELRAAKLYERLKRETPYEMKLAISSSKPLRHPLV